MQYNDVVCRFGPKCVYLINMNGEVNSRIKIAGGNFNTNLDIYRAMRQHLSSKVVDIASV